MGDAPSATGSRQLAGYRPGRTWQTWQTFREPAE
jgi:hypothetical protein